MFVVVYRWKITAGHEDSFRGAWRQMTESIFEKEGSLGSRLHRADDGTLVAYAQWPSRQRWQDATGSANPDAAARMKTCIETRYDNLLLEVTDNLLR
jgi:heme-degrading monooxygenase HmoA